MSLKGLRTNELLYEIAVDATVFNWCSFLFLTNELHNSLDSQHIFYFYSFYLIWLHAGAIFLQAVRN